MSNAHEVGREAGFAELLSYAKRGSKKHFEQVGKRQASLVYKRQAKQQEFLQGWMENWKDEPPTSTADDEILTY